METFSLYKVTATPILDIRRKKENNLYPVKYRITFLRTQKYYGSGIDMSKNDWISMPKSKKKDLINTRELILFEFTRIKEAIKDLYKKDSGFSFDALDKILNNGNKNSVFESFEKTIENLENEGRVGSSIAYRCALNSLKTFVKNRDLLFSDVNVNFLNNYEKWMLNEENSYTTIGIYLRQLRAILNIAKRDLIITEAMYPFGEGKYKIPTGKGLKKALTINQIKAIVNYPVPPNSIYEKCRDLWLFSYMCNGINITDLCRLKYSNIENGEIVFYRQKTIRTSKEKKRIAVTILPEMELIIDKWGNKKKEDTYIFQYLTSSITAKNEKKIIQNLTRQINSYMGKIGKDLDIGNVTTYSARHSFATVLKRSGANIAYISESLGHTDLKTTENYLASFEKEERIKNAQLLTQF